MKSHVQRIMCLGVTLIMLLFAVIGCGTGTANQNSSSTVAATTALSTEAASTAAAVADGTEWKSDISPIAFTVFVDDSSWKPLKNGWGGDPVTKEVTKRTGVTLDFTAATTDDSMQLNAMIAADDLPDFIVGTGRTKPVYQTLMKQGYLQPLNKLWEQYCPSMKTLFCPDQLAIYTEDDGNMYGLSNFFSDTDKIMKTPVETAFSMGTKKGTNDIENGYQLSGIRLEYRYVIWVPKVHFPTF